MNNNYEQQSQRAYDWTVDVVATAVIMIIGFQAEVIKHFSKLLWKMLKFTLWSMTKKNFWKGLLISLPATAFCVLLATTLSYFKPYTGVYFGHENKILQDKEIELINQVKEYQRKKKEFDLLEGLKSGNKNAIVEYVRQVFKDKADTALAIATCESGIDKNRVGDGHLTFNVNGKEYGKSYGVFQIRHLQGRPEPEQLTQAKFNVDYAYKVSNGGKDFTGAWVKCSKKIGLLSSL